MNVDRTDIDVRGLLRLVVQVHFDDTLVDWSVRWGLEVHVHEALVDWRCGVGVIKVDIHDALVDWRLGVHIDVD